MVKERQERAEEETEERSQTLSLRISQGLRRRLEDVREMLSLRRGERVSTSEVAKHLLEMALI
jgi:DNA-directed RNA polymerase specialized sigma24 family protein